MYVAYFPISSHVFLVLCFKFVILDNISTALLANSLNLSKFFCCCCHLFAKTCPTLATPWTVACQAPLSMGFSRQEYWNGLPFPSPGDLPDPGMEHRSSALQAEALPSEPPGSLNIWKFSVHILLKPSLENFEHYFASM